ncbi:hypothetical protein D3875_18335 [Deinococcus cavernae]|uniref:Uncharacterized protein n=1 Tax=Deinococcus cavernae TaxID=2320857 RepID=A0A418VAR4_9DEIO|nr:permease prefix domain 1-containing protein [Deinococcus cavernae]RJF73218.1 hypothetical protein D3875_18335 [Deinococcus cavernae]
MTTLTGTPAPLEAYLRRATLGLPPERREEVWNELEEHVLCRAEQLEFEGHSPEQALKLALRELGPPLRLSAAMNGVHNMPKLIAFATLTTLAVSAGLYALAQQPVPTMQIPVQTQAPRIQCVKPDDTQPHLPLVVKTGRVNCYQDNSGTQEGLYVSFSEVTKALAPTGIKAESSSDGSTLHFRTALSQPAGATYAVFKRNGESYLDANDLLGLVMYGNPFPVLVSGYEQPVFNLKNVSNIVLNGSGEQFNQRVYRNLAQTAARVFFDFSKYSEIWSYQFSEPAAQTTERLISTPFKPGEVIAAYQWKKSTPAASADGRKYLIQDIVLSLGVTDAQGNVKLKLPQDAKFTTTEPASGGNDVLLARLTNTPLSNMNSGLFLPN